MKTKINLLLAAFLVVFVGYSQQEECTEKLSLFSEAVKVKNYDSAYDDWMFVRKTCPKFNNAIYIQGEKILKHKIKNSTGGDKTAYVKDLMALHKESMANMPTKFPVGKTKSKIGLLMFEQKFGTPIEQFNVFDGAYTKDAKTFKHPKALYAYFKLMVGLFDGGTKDFQSLVNLYTAVTDKVDEEKKYFTSKKDPLLIKKENGSITKKEDNFKNGSSKSSGMGISFSSQGASVNAKI